MTAETVKAQYEHISFIHIYSLQPTPLKDLQTITDTSREIREKYAANDPLEHNKTYGIIQNQNVKVRIARTCPCPYLADPLLQRRTGRRPPPPKTSSTAKPAVQKAAKPAEDTKAKAAKPKEEPHPKSRPDSQASNKPTPQASESQPAKKAPTLKRDKSDIFKSFAKAKPKLKKEGTDSSAAASPAPDTVSIRTSFHLILSTNISSRPTQALQKTYP